MVTIIIFDGMTVKTSNIKLKSALSRKTSKISNTKPVDNMLDSAFHAFSQLARVVRKMVSWFPTSTEEGILAVYDAAVPTNTKTTTKFGLALFTNTVLLTLYCI